MAGLPDEGKTWGDEVAFRVVESRRGSSDIGVSVAPSVIVVPPGVVVIVTVLQSAAINVASATASVAELTMAATPRVRARVLRLLDL
jgi:hypothetical protein